jgi:hypothetical protein
MIFAHNLLGGTNAGCGERPGNDSVMTLANFTSPFPHPNGTTTEQAAVVMHELGHNLGLGHGGGDDINCKPNYLSVMNYTFIYPDYVNLRPLDYSRAELGGPLPSGKVGLNETSLSESAGIGPEQSPSLTGTKTVYLALNGVSPQVVTLVVNSSTNRAPVDWNLDTDTQDTVSADINKLVSAGCNGSGITELTGHNDWANLNYNGRVALDFVPDKGANLEQSSWEEGDSDGDEVGDAVACGQLSPLAPKAERTCVIDILPQEDFNLVNLGSNANIRVAWLSTPTFNAPLQLNTTVGFTLNDQPCFAPANVGSNPNVQDVNGDGHLDLVLRCDSTGLEFGTNLAVLTGFTTSGNAVRGRDFVTVK